MFLFHEANVQVFGGVPAGEVASYEHVVVTNDASNHVCRGDAFGSFSRNKPTGILDNNEYKM